MVASHIAIKKWCLCLSSSAVLRRRRKRINKTKKEYYIISLSKHRHDTHRQSDDTKYDTTKRNVTASNVRPRHPHVTHKHGPGPSLSAPHSSSTHIARATAHVDARQVIVALRRRGPVISAAAAPDRTADGLGIEAGDDHRPPVEQPLLARSHASVSGLSSYWT